MAKSTKSSNWGVSRGAGVSGEVGLGGRATQYEFRNFDTGENFSFLFGSMGLGISVGLSGAQKLLIKAAQRVFKLKKATSSLSASSYKKITVNRPFSAEDLDLSRGAEMAAGATAVVGVSWTRISAMPFWTSSAPTSGAIVNNDWFTAQDVFGADLGAGASAALQPYGIWMLVD